MSLKSEKKDKLTLWEEILSHDFSSDSKKDNKQHAFSGDYWKKAKDGIYRCAYCSHPLFDSKHKIQSENGWPVFNEPFRKDSITLATDYNWGNRQEVHCGRCDAHLGHLASNQSNPNGFRYCLNHRSLKLDEKTTI